MIERNGRPLAALVPVERLEQMRRFARRHALEFMHQQQRSVLTHVKRSPSNFPRPCKSSTSTANHSATNGSAVQPYRCAT
jgi:hypothetical protein